MPAEPLDAIFERLTAQFPNRPVVFDADGTLWRGDVGEDFLRYGLANGLFQGSYARYEALHAESPPRAYAYCVEVLAGCSEDEVRAEATRFFDRRYAGRVYPYVRPLLARLKAAGHPVWICSASPRLTVLPGAAHLGIPDSQVIGVTCSLSGGVLSGVVDAPVPAGPGKVTWLKRHGVQAALAVGNGDLDLDMLAEANLAVAVTPRDSTNGLVLAARSRDWPVLLV